MEKRTINKTKTKSWNYEWYTIDTQFFNGTDTHKGKKLKDVLLENISSRLDDTDNKLFIPIK